VLETAQQLVQREMYTRSLYVACIRTLGEARERRVVPLLKSALASEAGGGAASLSAACFVADASLATPLIKLAAARQAYLALGAETARVCRGEANGAHLASLAPMIKESHRIALVGELFAPLGRSPAGVPGGGQGGVAGNSAHPGALPGALVEALRVLRGAERHLGRWLILAEVAVRAGDGSPIDDAMRHAAEGSSSTRAAWSLAAWALRDVQAGGSEFPGSLKSASKNAHATRIPPPATRATMETLSRLSDRPSADRDLTFLFRMARADASGCRPVLEAVAKRYPLSDENSVRAAGVLARDPDRNDARDALVQCAQSAERDDLRGLATAILYDTAFETPSFQARSTAHDLAEALLSSASLSNVTWATLVRIAHAASPRRAASQPIANEATVRWVQCGWLE